MQLTWGLNVATCYPVLQTSTNANMGAGASREELPRHRSLNCRIPTVIEFLNGTPHTVCTVWLDYNGGERRYFTLKPGDRVRQPSFTSHPWSFVAPDVPDALCVVQDQAFFYGPPVPQGGQPQLACITLARSIRWCPAHHPQFPPDWHPTVAVLLCCHHRLAQPGGSCGGSKNSSTAAAAAAGAGVAGAACAAAAAEQRHPLATDSRSAICPVTLSPQHPPGTPPQGKLEGGHDRGGRLAGGVGSPPPANPCCPSCLLDGCTLAD